jgi:hypothetical protein
MKIGLISLDSKGQELQEVILEYLSLFISHLLCIKCYPKHISAHVILYTSPSTGLGNTIPLKMKSLKTRKII